MLKSEEDMMINFFKKMRHLVSYLQHKSTFKEFHWADSIKDPILITPRCIELGDNVYIGHQARIQGVYSYGAKKFNPQIIIEEGVSIEQNLHLTCANLIKIGKNTAIAAGVTITDINHPYEDINVPIERQNIEVKEVIIGQDSKIYNNVVVLPGVHIGTHCVIGANSVVTKDIPDYCVAVGSPARVIKQYNFENRKWEKI